MIESDVRRVVAEVLATVAPDADLEDLAPASPCARAWTSTPTTS